MQARTFRRRPISTPMRSLPLALLLALVACAPTDPAETPEADGPAPSPPTAEAPEPAGADTLSITTDTADLAARPAAPVRVEGACPFEGCVYGPWTTSAETTVYAAADASSASFTVPAGTALEADRGFVLVTRLGEVVVDAASDLYLASGETAPLAPGDTLLVLDYEGEGSSRVWFDGRIGFSEAGGFQGPPGEEPALRPLTEAVTEWWAHVTAPDGRRGWLWMDETPDVSGADALGG